MKLYDWFKVLIYILLWIFTWTLLHTLSVKYEFTDDDNIKISLIGIIIIIQKNPNINIS